MKSKRLFKKNNYNRNNKNFIILVIICIIIPSIYYVFFKKNDYFIIPLKEDSFYIIPKDKGGQKILNQDKKSLHLSDEDNKVVKLTNNFELEYSIQLITNENYKIIVNKRIELLNSIDTIFFPKDLFIVVLDNSLGNEYFLLYKNFISYLSALEHCEKYAYFLDKCVIVNLKNLD